MFMADTADTRSVATPTITDYSGSLKRSLEDKLFFTDVLASEEIGTVAEFGCAGGHILTACAEDGFGSTYIGHDLSQAKCRLAQASLPNGMFLYQPNLFDAAAKSSASNWRARGKKSVLVLSSVIHEVLPKAERPARWLDYVTFWQRRVQPLDFDFVVIRDMCVSAGVAKARTPGHLATAIRRDSTLDPYVRDFEEQFGTLDLYRNLVHFCLKMRSKEYWEFEMKEQYLIPSPPHLQLAALRFGGYTVRHCDLHQPDFIADNIYQNFGFCLPADTHISMVFEKVR